MEFEVGDSVAIRIGKITFKGNIKKVYNKENNYHDTIFIGGDPYEHYITTFSRDVTIMEKMEKGDETYGEKNFREGQLIPRRTLLTERRRDEC